MDHLPTTSTRPDAWLNPFSEAQLDRGQGRRGPGRASRSAPCRTCSTGRSWWPPPRGCGCSQAIAELGFVRNESGRQLRARPEPLDRLRDARRRQPVLHRRGQGHRGGRAGPRRRGVHLQQRQRRDAGGRLPRAAPAAARARRPGHAGRPGHVRARRAPAPEHPGRARRPRRRHRLVQRRRRRRRRRRARRDPPGRAGPPADRVRRWPDDHGAGRRPAARRPPGAARGRSPGRRPGGASRPMP